MPIKIKMEYSELYRAFSITEIKGIRNAQEWLIRTLEKYAAFSCNGKPCIDWESIARLPENHADYIPYDLKKRIILVS